MVLGDEKIKKKTMNPKELRIGNHIAINGVGEIVRGISPVLITVSHGRVFEFMSHKIEPIQLALAWLEWFGFSKDYDTNKYLNEPEDFIWSKSSFCIAVGKYGKIFYGYFGGTVEIKYVHQLQNLYFALTGEELEIEES